MAAIVAILSVSMAPPPRARPADRTFDDAQRTNPIALAIRAEVGRGGSLIGPLTPDEIAALHRLYDANDDVPRWLDADGRPGRDAHDALGLIAAAPDDGLDPDDYGQLQLDALKRVLEIGPMGLPHTAASFDVGLSAGLLRYLRDLHMGHTDPRVLGFRLPPATDRHDFAAVIAIAAATHRVVESAAELRPRFGQYNAVRAALAQYRALQEGAVVEPIPQPTGAIRPGQPYADVAVLTRQLVTLGDMSAEAASEGAGRYVGPVVEGVKRFQVRHGLEPDGVLGNRTVAALRVPIAWRIRQLELALERLRWLPHLRDERLVAINVPMFRLWAWNSTQVDGGPAAAMGVIVGRALRTQTPVFVEQMTEVIFRPYWNVPSSILVHEILPKLARDAGYLSRENMEVVSGPGDGARAVEFTPAALAELRRGTLRLRQRPGPRNSLGLIKFVFPNREDVYMHGTPAQALFAKPRRDFSHGCVRVQDPVTLAEWVLKDLPEWNREKITEAMNGTQSFKVRLPRPIQVVLFYTTAAVMPEDGTTRFAEDIYRHDVPLDRALSVPRSAGE